ncbi:MAG: Fic family protein [Mailhella sp.]|nr:Fic family protein [Mailhella sp.]
MYIPSDKTFLTFKAGKWRFSASCDTAATEPLLARAEALHSAVAAMPLLPDWKAELYGAIIRRSIHGTAAIEGNPMTQAEVDAELTSGAVSAPPSRERREIANLKALYAGLVTAAGPVSEELVRSFHKTLTHGLEYEENTPGLYRNTAVRVGDKEHGGVYVPPKSLDDIRNLMREFFAWFSGKDFDGFAPLLKAACLHYHLVRIHPFRDGNGRTARFAEAHVLASSGMPLLAPMLCSWYAGHVDGYCRAISAAAARGDMTPFYVFFLTAACEQLDALLGEMTPMLRAFILRGHVAGLFSGKRISRRQKALLDIMLDKGTAVDLLALYEDPAFAGHYRQVSKATARRDLIKLADMGLLVREGNVYAMNAGLTDLNR